MSQPSLQHHSYFNSTVAFLVKKNFFLKDIQIKFYLRSEILSELGDMARWEKKTAKKKVC